jgi:hypothetical protein
LRIELEIKPQLFPEEKEGYGGVRFLYGLKGDYSGLWAFLLGSKSDLLGIRLSRFSQFCRQGIKSESSQ